MVQCGDRDEHRMLVRESVGEAGSSDKASCLGAELGESGAGGGWVGCLKLKDEN